jgi:hypothetical protein
MALPARLIPLKRKLSDSYIDVTLPRSKARAQEPTIASTIAFENELVEFGPGVPVDTSDTCPSDENIRVGKGDDWSIEDMNSLAQSQYPPREEERDWYYEGLDGPPVLIARTSSTAWTRHQERGRGCKSFRPISQHEILLKWSSDVEHKIIEALKGCDWRFFYPTRIVNGQDDSSHVILLIGVNGIDFEWDPAIQKALLCRRILQGADISDVEVELMDAVVSQQVSFRKHFNNRDWILEDGLLFLGSG